MAYSTINKPSLHFNTVLYTGDGTSSNAITGVGFQPDFLWIKQRSAVRSHQLMDAVRGASFRVLADSSAAESASALTSFDSDGFTVDGSTLNGTNASGGTFVSWNWKADNTSGSSNTDGDITSTVAANTTAGLSIVKYTGNGLTNQTVGHGLGVTPALIMYKGIDAVHNWLVYHQSLGATQGIGLNLTGPAVTGIGYFDNTAPTSSVFSVSTTAGNDQNNISSEDYLAYCFAEVKGYSKFGSYTGNGSTDGPFIYTGFRPSMVILKKSTGTAASWRIYDNKRDPFNVCDARLIPNDSGAESTETLFDLCSNGFKLRQSDSAVNNSGDTYIYMCFADQTLVGTNNVCSVAR